MLNLPKINKELEEKGYSVFKLFSLEEVQKGLDFFNSKIENKAFTTHALKNKEHKHLVHEFLKSLFKNFDLLNYQPIWGNFMFKRPQSDNMLLHADWTYVNEKEQKSFNVWSPLVDTNLKNGCLWVVPYSHKLVKDLRGVGLPRFYENHENLLQSEYAIPLKLKKGEAVIYDHRIIHFSYPNYTSNERPAVTMIYVPKGSNYYHYYMNSNNEIKEYQFTDPNFLINLDFFDEPKAIPTKTIKKESIKGYDKTEIKLNLKKVNFFRAQENKRAAKKFKKFSMKSPT